MAQLTLLPFPLPRLAFRKPAGWVIIAAHAPLLVVAMLGVSAASTAVVAFWWESVVAFLFLLLALRFAAKQRPLTHQPSVIPGPANPNEIDAAFRHGLEQGMHTLSADSYFKGGMYGCAAFMMIFGCGFIATAAIVAAGNEPTVAVAGIHVIVPNEGGLKASNAQLLDAMFNWQILLAVLTLVALQTFSFVRRFFFQNAHATSDVDDFAKSFLQRVGLWYLFVAVCYVLIFIVPQLFALFVISGKVFVELVHAEIALLALNKPVAAGPQPVELEIKA